MFIDRPDVVGNPEAGHSCLASAFFAADIVNSPHEIGL